MDSGSVKRYLFTRPQDSADQKTLEVSTTYTMFSSGILNYSVSAVLSLGVFLGLFLTVAEFPLWISVIGSVYLSTISSFVMPRSGSGNAKPYAYQISAVLLVLTAIMYGILYAIPFTPKVVLSIASIAGIAFMNRRLYISLKDDMWYTTLNPPTRVILTLSNACLFVIIGLIVTGEVTTQLLSASFSVPLLLFVGYMLYRAVAPVYEQMEQYQENQEVFEEMIERNKTEVLPKIRKVNAILDRSDTDIQVHKPSQIDFRRKDFQKIQSDAKEAQVFFQQKENMEGGRAAIDLLQELQEYSSEYKFVVSY